MNSNPIVFSMFLIFTGAAVLATIALYTRQALLVAYIFLGLILGHCGLKLIADAGVVHKIGDIGIIFLLFLLGLNLHPQDLLHLFKKTLWITLFSSLVFLFIGFLVSVLFGFNMLESVIIGVAITFSSTIIGLKLLPTTVLHHQHIGEVVISILLLQDLLAILALLFVHIGGINGGVGWMHIGMLLLSLPLLLLTAFLAEKFLLSILFARFDRMKEYVFLLAIAWCLGLAELAKILGLSYEVGAFIAGVTIAAGPIAFYIAENLKPIRDFFLVMFFFSIGAEFDLHYFPVIIVPALILSVLLLVIKPITFSFLLRRSSEPKHVANEVGMRLGQTSSFSLLVAYLAVNIGLIGETAAYLIQATTLITFIVSSYLIVLRYPTPIAISEKLRRD